MTLICFHDKCVKTEANMFWWYYKSPCRIENPSWPIILWLQGGPVSNLIYKVHMIFSSVVDM